jgi:pyruvate kinase
MNKIQIIATIGPACAQPAVLRSLVDSGMSIARLNFSWGTRAEHRQFVHDVRAVAQAAGVHVPIIQDLSGPRVQQAAEHTFDGEVSVITDKDRADVHAMADLNLEYIALSFVKDAEDINQLRALLQEAGSTAKVIAKIERTEAIAAIDEIIAAADGIMIARGDLGEAIPVETLPFVKKDILKRCSTAQKPAIVATQMLTSMIDSPQPSRADVSDIAHAVLDGATATMLSNETAVGTYPAQTVALMRRVVDEAQRHTKHTLKSF